MRHHMVSALLAMVELLHSVHSLWSTLLPYATLWWSTMLYAICSKYYSWNRSRYRMQISAGRSFKEMPTLLGACDEPLNLCDDASHSEKEVDMCFHLQSMEQMCPGMSPQEVGSSMSYSMERKTGPGAIFSVKVPFSSIDSQEKAFSPSGLFSLHLSGARWRWTHLPLTASQWRACFDLSGLTNQIGLSVDDHLCDPCLVRGSSAQNSDLVRLPPTVLKESNIKCVKYNFSGSFTNFSVEGVLFTNAIRGTVLDFPTGKKGPAMDSILCRQSKDDDWTSSRSLIISTTTSSLGSITHVCNVFQGSSIHLQCPFGARVREAHPSLEPWNSDKDGACHGADGVSMVSDRLMHYNTSCRIEGAALMDYSPIIEEIEGYGHCSGDLGVGDGDEDTGFDITGFRVEEEDDVHDGEVMTCNGFECTGFRDDEKGYGAWVGVDVLDDDNDDFSIDAEAEELYPMDTWWDKDAVLLDEQFDKLEDSIEQAWLVL